MGTVVTSLCVGGPLDGQRFDSSDPKRFRTQVRTRTPAPPYLEPNKPQDVSLMVESVTYVVETIRTGDVNFDFWVPAHQPIEKTVAILLEGYERGAIAARKAGGRR